MGGDQPTKIKLYIRRLLIYIFYGIESFLYCKLYIAGGRISQLPGGMGAENCVRGGWAPHPQAPAGKSEACGGAGLFSLVIN